MATPPQPAPSSPQGREGSRAATPKPVPRPREPLARIPATFPWTILPDPSPPLLGLSPRVAAQHFKCNYSSIPKSASGSVGGSVGGSGWEHERVPCLSRSRGGGAWRGGGRGAGGGRGGPGEGPRGHKQAPCFFASSTAPRAPPPAGGVRLSRAAIRLSRALLLFRIWLGVFRICSGASFLFLFLIFPFLFSFFRFSSFSRFDDGRRRRPRPNPPALPWLASAPPACPKLCPTVSRKCGNGPNGGLFSWARTAKDLTFEAEKSQKYSK